MIRFSLRQLTKHYPGGVVALDRLDLEVDAGEWLALVGPSGCGKTTTLRLLAGLETPNSGSIELGHTDASHIPPAQRNVSLVFQRPALYPHLSVADNLAFALRLRGMDRSSRDARTREVADRLGLTDLLQRRPDELSGGQQQRVALGRALARRPDLLLLDEPLSHLDLPLRAELRRELHLLRRDFPTTMMYVTHDPAEALAVGDRVAVLSAGRLQQVGRPGVLVDEPANRVVAALMSGSPMNFLDGLLSRDGDRLRFDTDGFRWEVSPPRAEWQVHAGRPLTLGIRAEDVEAVSAGSGADLVFRVEYIEPRDGASLLGLGLPRASGVLLARSGVGEVKRGDEIMVRCDWRRARLFDRRTGANLDAARTTSG